MRNFRELIVWQKSHSLALDIYKLSRNFPRDEVFGLTSQIKRAAASVPTNIAEGCGRSTDADFARFLHIAAGSACEVEYQLLLAHDLGFIEANEYSILNERINEIKKMLAGFTQRLKSNR